MHSRRHMPITQVCVLIALFRPADLPMTEQLASRGTSSDAPATTEAQNINPVTTTPEVVPEAEHVHGNAASEWAMRALASNVHNTFAWTWQGAAVRFQRHALLGCASLRDIEADMQRSRAFRLFFPPLLLSVTLQHGCPHQTPGPGVRTDTTVAVTACTPC